MKTDPAEDKTVVLDDIKAELAGLEKRLQQIAKTNARRATQDLLKAQNQLYAQLESLSWLQQRLAIKGQLPALRGWAASPDVLLRLHTHITAIHPKVVVELGSGASTLVIADALRQNGEGRLISIEHSNHYGGRTQGQLEREQLHPWVDMRIGELELWAGEHLSPSDAETPPRWYPATLLQGIEAVDLLWVDGPPGAICLYSRYPALPTLADRLSSNAEVWLDDTVRQEEKSICEHWAKDYSFEVEYLMLEKGLGRLTRHQVNEPNRSDNIPSSPAATASAGSNIGA